MLKVFQSSQQLNMAQLQHVYEQSIIEAGKENYSYLPEHLQFLRATEDFYDYVDFFLKDADSLYAIWMPDGVCGAALRLEKYRDGYLISGLETALTARRRGYATALIHAVQEYLSQFGTYRLYSHVDKKNIVSLTVHEKCGFYQILDHAVFIDGSVSHRSCTLCYAA